MAFAGLRSFVHGGPSIIVPLAAIVVVCGCGPEPTTADPSRGDGVGSSPVGPDSGSVDACEDYSFLSGLWSVAIPPGNQCEGVAEWCGQPPPPDPCLSPISSQFSWCTCIDGLEIRSPASPWCGVEPEFPPGIPIVAPDVSVICTPPDPFPMGTIISAPPDGLLGDEIRLRWEQTCVAQGANAETIRFLSFSFVGQFAELEFPELRIAAAAQGELAITHDISGSGPGIACTSIQHTEVQGEAVLWVNNTEPFGNASGCSLCFDIAVGIFRGGPITLAGSQFDDNNVALGIIAAQSRNVDPNRVTVRTFDAGNQLAAMSTWLESLNQGCERPPSVVLIGYSLGGDAVENASLPSTCTRITIDPINPSLVEELVFNQRDSSHRVTPAPATGTFQNLLAESPWPFGFPDGLLGHQVIGASERIFTSTDHESIVEAVEQSQVVPLAVAACLGSE